MNKTQATTKTGFHALVWKEEELYVAKTVEIELASQGKSKQEALKNLEEAIELYFEDSPKSLLKNLPSLTNVSIEKIFPNSLNYA